MALHTIFDILKNLTISQVKYHSVICTQHFSISWKNQHFTQMQKIKRHGKLSIVKSNQIEFDKEEMREK